MLSLPLLLVPSAVHQPGASPHANTTLGPVVGTTQLAGSSKEVVVNAFRGVPFAASTGGANRWRPPQPREPWTAPFNASQHGVGCVQPHHNPDVPCDGDPRCQSEDCLRLSVYCPAGAQSLPVYFWIYGGAFNEGMNYGPLDVYEGSELAARGGICVVAPNYRLGVLGFLVTDETPGNQAIKDQRAALLWARDNIASFGGDPDRITIGGQSAGAMSVLVHLVPSK